MNKYIGIGLFLFFISIITTIILLTQNKTFLFIKTGVKYLDVYNIPEEAVGKNIPLKSTVYSGLFDDVSKISGPLDIRNIYLKMFKYEPLYKDEYSESLFENFPINASQNSKLLGSYIINTPFCKYVEKTLDPNKFYIRLDGKSINNELNILSSILRENLNFVNQILVFNVDRNKKYDFLDLSYIVYNGKNIYSTNNDWLKLVKSAYNELFYITQIKHALWHTQVASIIFKSDTELLGSKIKEIFNMASNNVYFKAAQINTAFNLPLGFGQALNRNKKFLKYVSDYQKEFEDNFNINTIFEDYFSLNNSDPTLNWLPGMKSNVIIIKEFVDKVISKYKNIKPFSLFSTKLSNDTRTLAKLLQMLFLIGTAFHSTTLDFTKLIFTDIFDISIISKAGILVFIQTIVYDFKEIFGDIQLYTGTYFKDEVLWLSNILDNNRKNIHDELYKYNPLFKSKIFSTRDDMNKTGVTNSYTTYF